MKRLAAALILALGCSSSSSSGPTTGTYTLAFPSIAAAVAAEQVQVLVFDAADAGLTTCTDLVIARRSKQALPPTIAESTLVTPCDMAAGRGQVSVSYGPRAVLAVAERGGADYLIGCAVQQVGAGNAQVPVQLALATTTVAVPPTTCASLTDHCANRCP
jgi:hypothetical protein